ncbi:helix-turn-helix transcriptional regulator [Rickettsiaceae bacterium]|nr:helix-turn-helix transcriptional regulator [Rickettsiaceae bacterium]
MSEIILEEVRHIDYVVSQNLRKRRLKLGLTQQNIASVIGVSVQQVQKYETSVNRISSGKLYKIANFLNVPISFFFP